MIQTGDSENDVERGNLFRELKARGLVIIRLLT